MPEFNSAFAVLVLH